MMPWLGYTSKEGIEACYNKIRIKLKMLRYFNSSAMSEKP